VADNVKIRYGIDLSAPRLGVVVSDVEARELTPSDRDALARLMLDAYIGTRSVSQFSMRAEGWPRSSAANESRARNASPTG